MIGMNVLVHNITAVRGKRKKTLSQTCTRLPADDDTCVFTRALHRAMCGVCQCKNMRRPLVHLHVRQNRRRRNRENVDEES